MALWPPLSSKRRSRAGDASHARALCLLADVIVCYVITARANCAANQQKTWGAIYIRVSRPNIMWRSCVLISCHFAAATIQFFFRQTVIMYKNTKMLAICKTKCLCCALLNSNGTFMQVFTLHMLVPRRCSVRPLYWVTRPYPIYVLSTRIPA